jgi:L-aspartate oxidase
MKDHYNVLIAGSGAAACTAALCLPGHLSVAVITKSEVQSCNSFLAQGGISIAHENEPLEDFIEDTVKAGRYTNNRRIVTRILSESRNVLALLQQFGVEFDRNPDSSFNLHREGGHRIERIYHVGDYTGRAIMQALYRQMAQRSNIQVLPFVTVFDLLRHSGECCGVCAAMPSGEYVNLYADCTVLATGGIGGLFQASSNFRHIAGDGLGIALKHYLGVSDLEKIQIHPTMLYTTDDNRKPLVTEALRGAGAKLYDRKGNRFVDELLPRDVVSDAILKQQRETGSPFVYLDWSMLSEEAFRRKFPTVYQSCVDYGIPFDDKRIPVTPGQHYYMGGIFVDEAGRTTMPRLYAIGEAACAGFHGSNRLASNSLLEAVYFGRAAARAIAADPTSVRCPDLPVTETRPLDEVLAKYHRHLKQEIKRRDNKFYEQWLAAPNGG